MTAPAPHHRQRADARRSKAQRPLYRRRHQHTGGKSPADEVQGNEASEFSYYRLWTNKQGMNYYLRFSQRPDKETNFISLLSKQLLASILTQPNPNHRHRHVLHEKVAGPIKGHQ